MMFLLAGMWLIAMVSAIRIESLMKRVRVLEDQNIERLERLDRRVNGRVAG